MNYYSHHIGDYAKDTAHLSLLEDGCYRRMIDLYYTTEKPLPAEPKAIYRLVRARSRQECQAVDTILGEYFQCQEDGWHQKRCDQEIVKQHAKSDKARASAAQRWQCEGNANAYAGAMRTHSEGNANPIANSQEPIANSQEKPIPNPSDSVSGEAPDVPPGNGKDAKRKSVLPYLQDAEKVLDYLNATAARNFEFRAPSGDLTPNAVTIIQRLKDGYTAEQLREVVLLKAEKWRGDEKMAEYLRPQTLFGKQKFSQYVGELSHA